MVGVLGFEEHDTGTVTDLNTSSKNVKYYWKAFEHGEDVFLLKFEELAASSRPL
jgi:hypothetical protein